jgi:predicted lipoprotein with Yx(FWY)xxD motif
VRRSVLFAAVPVLALVVAACGSSNKSTSTSSAKPAPRPSQPARPAPNTPGGPTVSVASVDGLGPVLVNSQGKVLYTFVPDKDKKVTCVGACAAVWPPLRGSKAVGSGSVKASLLSSDPDPSGGRVVTYAGWPLYTYVADTGPGTATGQATNLNGGLWYVISPNGTVIRKKAGSSSTY